MRIAPADTFTLTEFRFRNNYPETEHKPSTCGIFITETTYPVTSKTNSLEREVNWISPCLYIINDLHIQTEQVHDCTILQVSRLARSCWESQLCVCQAHLHLTAFACFAKRTTLSNHTPVCKCLRTVSPVCPHAGGWNKV